MWKSFCFAFDGSQTTIRWFVEIFFGDLVCNVKAWWKCNHRETLILKCSVRWCYYVDLWARKVMCYLYKCLALWFFFVKYPYIYIILYNKRHAPRSRLFSFLRYKRDATKKTKKKSVFTLHALRCQLAFADAVNVYSKIITYRHAFWYVLNQTPFW